MTEVGGDDPPEDDLSVEPDGDLYRRVPPQHWHVVDGEFEVREGAFKNFPQPERKRMSIVLGDTLEGLERHPSSILPLGRDDYGVVVLKAAAVRGEDQRLVRSPADDEPAHGDVYGDKTPSRRKRLVLLATWVIYPATPGQ